MLRNFGVLLFLRSWKLTRFLTTCISATSFRIWTFSTQLSCTSPKRLERIFLKSLYIIFIMYIKMSETFITIDSLQHLKISRQTYPTNRSKICFATLLRNKLICNVARFTTLVQICLAKNPHRLLQVLAWIDHSRKYR